DVVLLVERHHRFVERLTIVLVLRLQPLQFWLQSLHSQHRSCAFYGKWRQNNHHCNSQKDDRNAVIWDQIVEESQGAGHRFGYEVKHLNSSFRNGIDAMSTPG